MSAEVTAESTETATYSANFESTLRAMGPRLHHYFARRIAVPTDIDDCVADVLAAMWRRKDDAPSSESALEAWTFGAARGILANYRRGESRRSALSARLHSEIIVRTAGPQESDIDVAALRSALAALSEKDRELFLLIAWDGLGVHEAGSVLGWRPAAARTRYARTRRRLRAHLESSS